MIAWVVRHAAWRSQHLPARLFDEFLVQRAKGKPWQPFDVEAAQRKNAYVLAHLARDGVQTYEAASALIRDARARGFRTAVVSASENCAAVLRVAGLETLFDVRVDGTDLDRLGLKGKPAPDTFLEAARRLGVSPARAVVFEDAIAGVQTGHAGVFALVVGVDRVGQADALHRRGADVVVTRLSDVSLESGP